MLRFVSDEAKSKAREARLKKMRTVTGWGDFLKQKTRKEGFTLSMK
jgi:hypothetical protein